MPIMLQNGLIKVGCETGFPAQPWQVEQIFPVFADWGNRLIAVVDTGPGYLIKRIQNFN